ncbi:class I SAM-dependent methyltransferase [Haloechinothrix sp. LS1_15]|uniref:O-methyltransferase n=1 Tax=Haloechinothrix sp. LS1_15 TaxID=2652248 RepID=UPI0029487194|nr:class I SAM-dependent methyltransferase [Haloechinothrix sp. LS1_15]MDV6011964.1 class I SAM-dependent methyltransferase [Haloechinothrix sp. LS1_15]
MSGQGSRTRRLGKRQADSAVSKLTSRLGAVGLLPPASRFDTAAFHELRAAVRGTFSVPESSITPIMARALFAIGDSCRPSRVLVIGSYCGNTLVWLAGRMILDHLRAPAAPAAGAPPRIVGCDTDEDACSIAEANFTRLGAAGLVEVVARDGHEVVGEEDGWDLILLDADDPVHRKSVYATLLENALPRLAEQAVVLAHDTAEPVFAEELAPFLERIRDGSSFRATAQLSIDNSGLSISVAAPRRQPDSEATTTITTGSGAK